MFAVIVGTAILLRCLAFTPYGIHHPDEAIQYIEQAHRLVFGRGLVPWEYRAGIRSWLPALILAGPMWLGGVIAPGSILYVVLPRLLFAAIILVALPAAWAIGARSSRAHAIVAATVVGCWYESVYFSVHVLTEPLAAALFLAAAALIQRDAPLRRLAAAGALLMLGAVVRFQYAPAFLLFALLAVPWRWRAWLPIAAGGLGAAAVCATIDLAMGQTPFRWIWANVQQNIVAGRAAQFGVLGPSAYAQMIWLQWNVVAVPIFVLAILGARRYPALFATALCVIGVHMAISHKEYRFIWLAVQILLILAAIGSVDVIARWRARRGDRKTGLPLWAVPVAGWLCFSLLLSLTSPLRPSWRRFAGGFELAQSAGNRPVCGLALGGTSYWASGGLTFLHRPIPFYYVLEADGISEADAFRRSQVAYDAILAPPRYANVPRNYRVSECRGNDEERLCLYVRPGGCQHSSFSDRYGAQNILTKNDL